MASASFLSKTPNQAVPAIRSPAVLLGANREPFPDDLADWKYPGPSVPGALFLFRREFGQLRINIGQCTSELFAVTWSFRTLQLNFDAGAR